MMPFVRGRFIPEIEDAGRVKRHFDVLLWGTNWSRQNIFDLDQIDILREYLQSLEPRFCGIRLFVPSSHTETIELLGKMNCSACVVEVLKPTPDVSGHFDNEELAAAVQSSIACDADVLVVTKQEWFPYVEDIEQLGVLIADTGHLKHQCEIFARGHDAP